MRIADFDLEQRVLIVAEIGNNHEGDPALAAELVRRAASAGANAIKLQTYRTDQFVRPSDQERYERLARFELGMDEVTALQRLAHSLGLLFLSTPLDLATVADLEPLVDAYKIASGDNNFVALLEAVAATRKPVVVSAGLSDLDGIAHALDALEGSEVAVLHCTSAYPAPPEEANLAAIPLLAERLGRTVGYSDHTLGIRACLVAASLGARLLEKHFTLDKNQSDFRDHRLSSDPPEFHELVESVREVELLLGTPEKALQPSEHDALFGARRSIVAARDLAAGDLVSIDSLTWLRPADGLPPGEERRLVGKTLRRPVTAGEAILPEDVG